FRRARHARCTRDAGYSAARCRRRPRRRPRGRRRTPRTNTPPRRTCARAPCVSPRRPRRWRRGANWRARARTPAARRPARCIPRRRPRSGAAMPSSSSWHDFANASEEINAGARERLSARSYPRIGGTRAPRESCSSLRDKDAMIRFDLSIQLDYAVQTASDFDFIIQPTSTPYQRVTWGQLATEPQAELREEAHGAAPNRHLRVHAEPGDFRFRYEAIVDLVHHFALPSDIVETPIAKLPAEVLQYIYPSRYCQSDRLLSVARQEFGSMAPGYERVEAIRRWVKERTRFQIGSSHPGTSAIDTYECGSGVCRDFSHLMIAICRALNIPARFATGIDYGADPALGPPDFHCYVEALLGE